MKKKTEILLSCMYENGPGIAAKSNIKKDVLIVSQCDAKAESIEEYPDGIRVLYTPTRGVSVSRNIAMDHAEGDFLMFSDDDEVFVDDAHRIISNAYEEIPDADIIIFKIGNTRKLNYKKIKRLHYLDLLRVGTWMISIKREPVISRNLRFDEMMGSGTGNGGGEENKFLIDCYLKGLKIYYYPVIISYLYQKDSKWFKGYDQSFFYRRGIVTRYMLGLPVSMIYALYFVMKHNKKFKKDISRTGALKNIYKGIINNDLGKQKQQRRDC